MKKIFKTLLFAFIAALLLGCNSNNTKCILRGEFVGFDEMPNEIWLINMVFQNNTEHRIKIKDGRFELELDGSHPQAFFGQIFVDGFEQDLYCVIVKEPGVVSFKVHGNREGLDAFELLSGNETKKAMDFSMRYEKNFSELTKAYDKRNKLINKGLFFSEKVTEVQELINKLDLEEDDNLYEDLTIKFRNLMESPEGFTLKGYEIKSQIDSLTKIVNRYYFENLLSDFSIFTYALLIQTITNIDFYPGLSFNELKALAVQYFQKFPNHPYTDYLKTRLTAMENIQVGNRFVDISAPDLEGNIHTLSEIIEGKYAILYLWGSWCAPCRKFSEAMVPVYEDFKDKGFTMVAIASENDRTIGNLKKFLESKNYPWLNLVEFNGENNIWPRYNAAGAGLSIFIDNNGTILKIDSSPDSIRLVLNEKLK